MPTDPFDTTIQYAKDGKGKHAIQLYQEHGYADGLTAVMEVWHSGRPHWSNPDFYPVKERLISGFAESEGAPAFMVDIGGGSGHDLVKFAERHPPSTFSGQLVLQDIPEVIEPLVGKLPHDIRAVAHDFLQPQPVQGKEHALPLSS